MGLGVRAREEGHGSYCMVTEREGFNNLLEDYLRESKR